MAAMVCLAMGVVVRADSVKITGHWVDNVNIQQVNEGKLVFTTDIGTEREQALAKIEGIKADAYPDLAEGQAALEAGDEKKALEKFSKVAGTARVPWARQWAQWHKLKLLDKDGQPVEALMMYLLMVKEKAQPFFLAMPPLNALKRARPDQVTDLISRVEKAQGAAGDAAAEQFKMMLDVLRLQAAEKPVPGMPAASGTSPAPKPAAGRGAAEAPAAAVSPPNLATTADTGDSAVPLPSFIEMDDAVTAMLRGGRFKEVIETTDDRLSKKEPKIAMRLYQKGVAQLHLALKDNDTKLLKDAGLTFMRVVVYFNKSSYKGPALVELGLIHQKIGDDKLAGELWRKARLELDPETDAILINRVDELSGAGVGEAAPPETPAPAPAETGNAQSS